MKKVILKLIVLMSMLVFAAPVFAFSLYNGSVSWSGGIYATPTWNNEATTLTWTIEDQNNGWVLYTYEWTTTEKNLSHLILQVSTDTPASDFKEFSTGSVVGPQWFKPTDPGNSNPGLPGDIYGIKITPGSGTTDFTVSFLSTHLPMWGNFYAKDGTNRGTNDVYAYNTGFGLGETPSDNGHFIAVPDTQRPPVPIPAAIWLFGSGLLGLFGIRRRIARN